MLLHTGELQGAAVRGGKIPDVSVAPPLVLRDCIAILVLRYDPSDRAHRLLGAGRIDDKAVVRLEEGHADHGVLVHVQHLAAAALDGAALGELGIMILLVVIVHNVLQQREVLIVGRAVYHGFAQKIPGGRIRDVLGRVADDPIIGRGTVILMRIKDVVIAEVILLQVMVLVRARQHVPVDQALNARLVQRLIRRHVHVDR